jgi:hypothetical protein
MSSPLDTTQQVLDYLKTTRHDTYDLSRCVKPHVHDVLLQLFLRINWMQTWFRTNHPMLAHKPGTPFTETVDFFKKVPEADFPTVFAIWALHLVNKFPIDSAHEVDGKITKTTEDYDKLNCLLNVVSDICFLPDAKSILLDKTYLKNLDDALHANLIRSEKSGFTLVTNPMLAQEICTQVLLRRYDLPSKLTAAPVASPDTTK